MHVKLIVFNHVLFKYSLRASGCGLEELITDCPICLYVRLIGEYKVDVVYFGQPISNSPFTVKAWDSSKVIVTDIASSNVGSQSSFKSGFFCPFNMVTNMKLGLGLTYI